MTTWTHRSFLKGGFQRGGVDTPCSRLVRVDVRDVRPDKRRTHVHPAPRIENATDARICVGHGIQKQRTILFMAARSSLSSPEIEHELRVAVSIIHAEWVNGSMSAGTSDGGSQSVRGEIVCVCVCVCVCLNNASRPRNDCGRFGEDLRVCSLSGESVSTQNH